MSNIQNYNKKTFLKIKQIKQQGKKIGLITGCFDILHIGHIDLIKFAKSKVDFLIVYLDSDKTISLAKGKKRPINNLKQRAGLISEIKNVDMVIKTNQLSYYGKSDELYTKILLNIKPDLIITSPKADIFWKNKKEIAKKLKIKCALDNKDKINSSTKIINKLIKNE